MAGSLDIVKQHFAGQDRILELLYNESDSFRSLCEDFQDCLKARDYWCGNSNCPSKDALRCGEYASLCEELKHEIMSFITVKMNCSGQVNEQKKICGISDQEKSH